MRETFICLPKQLVTRVQKAHIIYYTNVRADASYYLIGNNLYLVSGRQFQGMPICNCHIRYKYVEVHHECVCCSQGLNACYFVPFKNVREAYCNDQLNSLC